MVKAYRIKSGGILVLDLFRLKEVREARGLTLGAVADACGVTRQLVAQWENATTAPNDDSLLGLIDLLGQKMMRRHKALTMVIP